MFKETGGQFTSKVQESQLALYTSLILYIFYNHWLHFIINTYILVLKCKTIHLTIYLQANWPGTINTTDFGLIKLC